MPAKIVISRDNHFAYRRKLLKVMIDDVEAGVIPADGSQEFEVTAGLHTIRCTSGLGQSNVYELTVQQEKIAYVKASVSMKLYFAFYLLLIAGLLFPLVFRILKTTQGDWIEFARIVMIAPFILYNLYYYIFNRKGIFRIEADDKNMFAT